MGGAHPPRRALHRPADGGRGRRGDRRRVLRRAGRVAGVRRADAAGPLRRGRPGAHARPDAAYWSLGGPYGEVPDGLTLDKVKAAPHGIDLGPMVPRIAEVL